MTTRAVHLEFIPSMDTNCNWNRMLHCWAGNDFRYLVGHWHEFRWLGQTLISCMENWDRHAPGLLAYIGLVWKSNPPSATHLGSVWERLVPSAKKVFYDFLGTRKLTEEVLITTFCLVEQSLNKLALTPVSSDPNNLEVLKRILSYLDTAQLAIRH